mgnify:CR=1 FL=1
MSTDFFNDQWRMPNNKNQSLVSNYSMDFDGISDIVNTTLTPPTGANNRTFSVWFKTGVNAFKNICGYGTAATSQGFDICTHPSPTTYSIGVHAYGPTIIANGVYIPNQWNHYVVTYDGTILRGYLNGQPVNTSTIALNTGTSVDFTINGGAYTGANGYSGSIDQVSVFDYVLSASQVSTLHGGGTAVINPMSLSPRPVAYYQLGDQSAYNGAYYLVPNQVATGGDVFQSVPLRTANAVPTDTITSNINYTGTPGVPDAFTVSFWMKDSIVGNASVFFDHDASTYTTSTPKGAFVYFDGGRVLIYLKANFWRYYSLPAGVNLTDSDWRNIVVYMDPTSISLGKVWIDGTPLALSNGNPGGGVGSDFTAGFKFYLNNFGSNVMYFKDYEIDNAGATLLYNNGAPLLDTSTLAQAPDHWWKLNASDTFDIATSTWTIKDHVGSENGTSVNMDALNLVSSELLNTGGRQGYSPYALSLDGTNDVINCGNDSSLQITGAMTVSYWFKGQGGSASVGGVGKLGGGSSRGFCLGMVSSGNITFYIAPTAATLFTLGYLRTADTDWHHLVGVYNPSTSVQIYLDGTLVKETTSTVPASQYNGSNDLQIGARGDNSGAFNGEMSNAAIWNTNLSTTEIEEIYNQGLPSNLNTFSGIAPVSWWQLGSNSSYNSGAWNCLDEIGTNNGVSAGGMTNDNITNGVGYTENGLGESTIEIVGDAPYSTANGISENIDALDRTTDVPS